MTQTPDSKIPDASLADRLKQRTHALHTVAERTGVTGRIIRGQASRQAYALLLLSLAPIYQEMEKQLNAVGPLRIFAKPPVARSGALAHDLTQLIGPDWPSAPPPSQPSTLPAAVARYVSRVREAAAGDGSRLIAHAYVRYLGDLNGGQALTRLLHRSLGLTPDQLTFYDFPGVEDLSGFRLAYRTAIDHAGAWIAALDPVIEEAAVAFQLNIDLSVAVALTADDSSAALA